jgi:hypothetical protein
MHSGITHPWALAEDVAPKGYCPAGRKTRCTEETCRRTPCGLERNQQPRPNALAEQKAVALGCMTDEKLALLGKVAAGSPQRQLKKRQY